MELYQKELEDAVERIRSAGRDPDDFAFDMGAAAPSAGYIHRPGRLRFSIKLPSSGGG